MTNMTRAARLIVSVALAILFCAIVSCRTQWKIPVARERALDVILLCENSAEAGPLLFAHRRHYAASAEGGVGIPCAVCHHDYKPSSESVPEACSKCHPSHDEKSIIARTPL